jgi:hypothetical protein
MALDYSIPPQPMKRLRYFNNQFLSAQDFIDDQAAHLAHERAHLRALCVAGVCEGLAVTIVNPTTLSIAPGVAVDNAGRLIALDVATNGPPVGSLTTGDYLLHILYNEVASALTTPGGAGASDFTRWQSQPTLGATLPGSVPAGAVVLAGFHITAGLITGSLTMAPRKYSGLRLPGPGTSTFATLTTRADGTDDGAVLNGTLTVRRDVAGALGPTLALTNGLAASGTAGGGAIDFSPYDPGTNAPAARIQSFSDNNSSSDLAVLTKTPGNQSNALVERLRIKSDGTVQFANTVSIATGQHVVVSGGGLFKHGTKTINIPVVATGLIGSPPPATAAVSGTAFAAVVTGVPVGARIATIRAKVIDAATSNLTLKFFTKVVGTTTPVWTQVGSSVVSVTNASVQVLTLSSLAFNVTAFTEMAITITPSGSALTSVCAIELDYDQP